MNFGQPEFVLWIVAICTAGWLINNWIRARHGYALEDEWGGKTERIGDASAKTARLENEELREQLAHFADRVKVLERIVTDRGYDVSTQIEALREGRNISGREGRNISGREGRKISGRDARQPGARV